MATSKDSDKEHGNGYLAMSAPPIVSQQEWEAARQQHPITLINGPQVLPSPFVPQPDPPPCSVWLGYILNGATLLRSVTF